jgi:hypothetical protein
MLGSASVILKGGLGNQMFQHAFAKAYSLKNRRDVALDIRYLNDRTWRPKFTYRGYALDIFKSQISIAGTRPYRRGEIYIRLAYQAFLILNQKTVNLKTKTRVESNFYYDPQLLDCVSADMFVGYFQSFKYFDEIRNDIKSDFQVKDRHSAEGTELHAEISRSNSVCINVRRTDLVDSKLGVPSANYYKVCVEKLKNLVERPTFYLFSDDIDWCKQNFNYIENKTIVGHEYAGERFATYFHLMSSCNHFIIPNSTFAWWAAYLSSQNGKIVFAPRGWHRYLGPRGHSDILPNEWNTVELDGNI